LNGRLQIADLKTKPWELRIEKICPSAGLPAGQSKNEIRIADRLENGQTGGLADRRTPPCSTQNSPLHFPHYY
jgi:hypothetical protein